MSIRRTALGVAILFLSGCSSLLVSSTPPPVYYQLDYRPPIETCGRQFPQGVRIQPFTASSPFDQPAMVVQKSAGRVLFSSAYQWSASPGTLLAQSLQRDLSLGTLFPQVVSPNSPTLVPLELTGHVFTFAWMEKDSRTRAALQVEISLIDTETRQVLLRKIYRPTGATFSSDDADTFARAMGALTRHFSAELQRDLCQRIPTP